MPVFSGAPRSPSINSIPCSAATRLKLGYNMLAIGISFSGFKSYLIMGGGQVLCEFLPNGRKAIISFISGCPKRVTSDILWGLDDLEDRIVRRNSFESDTVSTIRLASQNWSEIYQHTQHAILRLQASWNQRSGPYSIFCFA